MTMMMTVFPVRCRRIAGRTPSQLTGNKQAPPLLLARRACGADGGFHLLVTLVEVLDRLLGLLLDVGHSGLLLDDQGVHVLEQLRQLDQLLLDLLQLGLTVLDGRQDGLGLATSVALHQSLLEDLATSVLNGGLDFALVGVGPHNTVLPGHLVLRLFTELGLVRLVRPDGLLEATVDSLDLGAVLGQIAVGVALDHAHPLSQGAVEGHGLGAEAVELPVAVAAGRAIGIVERPLLEHAHLVEVLVDGVDAFVDIAALVQNGIRVGAAALRERRHFDVG